jgi:glutamate/tyrosine decarboxylase-like PLP-dependent enzyme
VRDICDRLCEQFEVAVKPHIHVDSAIGWPLIFFLDYDFNKNPLRINSATLPGLRRNVERFRELKFADSFTVDFQKRWIFKNWATCRTRRVSS